MLIAGTGRALNFTLLEASATWLQAVVAVVALAASFIAGWILLRLRSSMLLPIVVMACLSVAFGVFDTNSQDLGPIAFVMVLSIIYGSLTSALASQSVKTHSSMTLMTTSAWSVQT